MRTNSAKSDISEDALAIKETDRSINSSTTMDTFNLATDPMYRIGQLNAANAPPVCVSPDADVTVAVTLLMAHGYSQLPVISGKSSVKGIISWASIGSRLMLGHDPHGKVCDFMKPFLPIYEVGADESIFMAIPAIIENDFVLVRGAGGAISGIVTATDLSVQFRMLTEPFLLLGEIENHLRGMVLNKFSLADMRRARHTNDTRPIGEVKDMNFGEFKTLLEGKENWEKFGFPIDRVIFCELLAKIGKLRNEVMHFNPKGLSCVDLESIQKFANLLRQLKNS